jgi:hypothetical protein
VIALIAISSGKSAGSTHLRKAAYRARNARSAIKNEFWRSTPVDIARQLRKIWDIT